MRRRLAFTTVLLLVSPVLVGTTAVTAGASSSSSRTAASTGAVAPAKVKTGSTWTLERTGTGCENDTFGKRKRFAAVVTDGSGDRGTYRGSKHLAMTWKAGLDAGAVFVGQWRKADGDYSGTYSLGGQRADATLVPYVSGACLSSTSLTGQPSSATVLLGLSGFGATDTATVFGSGGVTPTGTVAFYVCPGDSDPCTVGAATAGGTTLAPVAVAGTGSAGQATSAVYTPPGTGSYCFLAVYSGDTHYAVSSDGSTTDQCFTVVAADGAIATTPSTTSFTLGGSVFDTATVTGAGGIRPTGTVTFSLCGPESSDTCTNADLTQLGQPVTLAATTHANVASADSISDTPTETGTYCLVAVYSGDGNYSAGYDASSGECFTVTPAPPA